MYVVAKSLMDDIPASRRRAMLRALACGCVQVQVMMGRPWDQQEKQDYEKRGGNKGDRFDDDDDATFQNPTVVGGVF